VSPPPLAEIVQPDDDGPREIGFLVPDGISYHCRDVYITISFNFCLFRHLFCLFLSWRGPLPAGCPGDSPVVFRRFIVRECPTGFSIFPANIKRSKLYSAVAKQITYIGIGHKYIMRYRIKT